MCSSKPKVTVTEAPPTAAPVANVLPQTAQASNVGSEEGRLTKRKRAGRNSLRIDTNLAGASGAGGNGLNIPR